MTSLPQHALRTVGEREHVPTILIIDDNIDGRIALQALLSGQGYALAFATNGIEGLDQAAVLIPDLIMLDVMMPGIDGLEVCRRLRDNPLLAEVPIIMVTAHNERDLRIQAIEAGADDFVSKQFDTTELRARVRTITRLNRYRRLIQERAKFERVVELAPHGLLIVDGDGIITMTNPALLRLFGAECPDEIVGQNLLAFVEPTQHDQCVGFLSQTIAEPNYVAQFESTFVRLNGEPFPAEVDIGHFIWEGVTLAQVIIRDITRRRQLEARLLQAQKIESIGRLASGVAHDFNNLLTAIIGYTELSLDMLPPEADERDELTAIHKAAQSAAILTQRLLTFAREQKIEPRVFYLNDLLIDLNKLIRRLVGEAIEIVMHLAPDLGQIKADPGQIEQVLINLIINARDAMPDGGRITIETCNIVLDPDRAHAHAGLLPGTYVALMVSDTGLGMEAIVKDHIFEPFFTTKEAGHGTGLGLAMCYGTIKQHGGMIDVVSELNQGTLFTIYLPRVDELGDVLPQSTSTGNLLPQGNETVLIVEDEMDVRTLVARILTDLGYRVREASNGDDALAILSEHAKPTVDIVLTDVVMPRMGGKVLAEQVIRRYPEVKILFMSGYSEHSQPSHGAEHTIPFLQKPFSAAILAHKVRDVLDH